MITFQPWKGELRGVSGSRMLPWVELLALGCCLTLQCHPDAVSPSLQALCALFLSLVLLMTSNHSLHLRSSGSFCVPMGVSDCTLAKVLIFPKPTQSPFLPAILTSQTKELFLIRCAQSLVISQGPQGGFLVRTRNKWAFLVVSLFL